MIKAVSIGFACFVLFLITHVVLFRALKPRERFKVIVANFLAMVLLYFLFYYLVPEGHYVLAPVGEPGGRPWIPFETEFRITAALNFLGGLMLYVFLFLGYCQFYFIIDRSISVRVMIEIEKAPNGRLDLEGIKRAYSLDGILARRLEHMVEGGYLRKTPAFYTNTGKGRRRALLFAFLKELLRIGEGG